MKNFIKTILTVLLSFFYVVTMSQVINVIDFKKHGDIKIFFTDLVKTVKTNDINNIVEMIYIPLIDEFGDNPGNRAPSLGCKTTSDVYNNFDKIFTKGVKSSIMKIKYRGYDAERMNGDVIQKGEYLIEGDGNTDGDSPRPHIMLGIKKVNGIFKIYAIKFYS